MNIAIFSYIFMGLAGTPFIYYAIVLYSSWQFFRRAPGLVASNSSFVPPVSNLKPVKGLDPEAYENFASFCRQDYPNYEVVFCVDETDTAVLAVIEKLIRDFPECRIRVLLGSLRNAVNDKVAKLTRLVSEAQHETLVISDSDVRVAPDYLRTVVAPLANPKVGAVTCLYLSTHETTFTQNLQTVGMISDFYPGILVARQLDGVKFALGPTIVTTRARLAGFGGYQVIENRPADDLLVGRLIADQGCQVELLAYPVSTVADYDSFRDLLRKRLRWIVVMRNLRPWGHLGLIFTHGLAWSLLAALVFKSPFVASAYLGSYLVFRMAITWMIGIHGLKQPGLWKKMLLIPLWDAVAFLIWLISFTQNSIWWRGGKYYIRNGELVAAVASPSADVAESSSSAT